MLVSLGLEHRNASVQTRERFHLEDEDVLRIGEELGARGAHESVLTRTCNRVEAYCWWPESGSNGASSDSARAISEAWVGGDAAEAAVLREHAYIRRGPAAARHLFRVSTGLESQILGDIHILGQIRRAYLDAQCSGSVGTHLHRLFETALRVGKLVKRDTELMATRSSVGSEAALRAARQPAPETLSCVIVGCGKSGTQAARTLRDLGVSDLTVLNRTIERAEKLARDLGTGRAAGLDAIDEECARADVVIIATGATEPVLDAAGLQRARSDCGATGRLLVIDVSMPRNVDPAVGELSNIELLDLDGLHPIAAHIERSRREAVPEAEHLVEASVHEFDSWLKLRTARQALDPFREMLGEICRRELAHVTDGSDRVENAANRIVARVMAQPMEALRAACLRGEPITHAAVTAEQLFDSFRDRLDVSGTASTPRSPLAAIARAQQG